MKKNKIIASLIILCFMLIPMFNFLGTTQAAIVPETKIKKLVIAYGNTLSYDSIRRFIASHFDIVICTTSAYSQAKILKSLNPNIKLLAYFHAVGMSLSLSDWSYVNKQESWFVHSTSGTRVKNLDWNFYLMNPNSGWATYFANRCKTFLTNYPYYDGVFIDDIPLSFSEMNYNLNVGVSSIPTLIKSSWEYGLTQQMVKTKSAIGSKTVLVNAWKSTQLCEQVTHAHFWEEFVHSKSSAYNNLGYSWTSGWSGGLLAIDLLHKQAELGNIIGVNSGMLNADLYTTSARRWQTFTLGCFLMSVMDMSKSYYSWQFINTDSSKGYFPEMDYNWGYPIGDYKTISYRTYMRTFSNYYVIVNLDMSAASHFHIDGIGYTLPARNALFIKK